MAKQGISMEELRTKSIDDLAKLGEDRRAELFALRFQAATGSLEQTHKIKILKVEIARIEMLLGQKRTEGQVAKVQKADYAAAVNEAEKAGKAVRQKQREMIEQMQKEQAGMANDESSMGTDVSEDMVQKAMEAAMAQAAGDEKVPAAEVKAEDKKEAAPKATTAKKTTTTKAAAPKAEAKVEAKPAAKKEAAKKEAAPKVETPKVDTAEAKPTGKGKASTAKVDLPKVEAGEAKGTGKGKAALGDVEVKKIKTETVQGEDIEGIQLKLAKKPKDAKTYVFGANAADAKKQIDEANKKAAEKKATKTTTAKDTEKKPAAKTAAAKKTTTTKGAK